MRKKVKVISVQKNSQCKRSQETNTDKRQEYQESTMDQHSLNQQLRFQADVAENEYFKVRFEREQ